MVLDRNVGARISCATRLAAMRTSKMTGFVGWVTCEIKDKESEWNKVTYMLAKYVEHANVGGNKTR